MTKEEILDYVMNTPDNTNRMVLNDMLDEFSNGFPSSGASSIIVHYTMEGDGDDGRIITIEEDWEGIAAVGEAGGLIIAQDRNGNSDATFFARYYPAEEVEEETFPANITWVVQAFDNYDDGMQFYKAICGYASTGESYYGDEQHWYVKTYNPNEETPY